MEQAVRRGLVLGAGGVLGAAWSTAALEALTTATGWDPRTGEVIVGTSAGSVLAAALGSGLSVETLANHQRGIRVEGDVDVEYDHDTDSGGATPPRPRLRPGSTALLRRAVLHPSTMTPTARAAALLPEGRGSLAPVTGMVAAMAAASADPGGWPQHPQTWIVAMDYDTGRRVVFGRAGAPAAELATAVTASCSIPGWYSPVTIGTRRYVDGGTCSATSLDLVAPLELDEVYVLAPMAEDGLDHPRTVVGRLERQWRRSVSKRLAREAAKVAASGTRIITLAPGPEDLRAIGVNMMDPRRRDAVFRTSLRTSAASLAAQGLGHGAIPVVHQAHGELTAAG